MTRFGRWWHYLSLSSCGELAAFSHHTSGSDSSFYNPRSAVFFLGTVGYFVWGIAFALNSIADEATQAKGVQYGELVVSATFVTSIPIYAFYKIYNVMTELHGNG